MIAPYAKAQRQRDYGMGMMQSGMNSASTSSPYEGVNRLAQGLLGGYMSRQGGQQMALQQQLQRQQQMQLIAQMLRQPQLPVANNQAATMVANANGWVP